MAKIYIAGKISDLPFEEAESHFIFAAGVLESFGHVPLNPCRMFPENPVWDWAEYMLADLRIIWTHADAVLMLDNWKDSKGARLEHHAAELVGKPIYYALDEVPEVSR